MFSTDKAERATQIKGMIHASALYIASLTCAAISAAKIEQRDHHVRESWVKAMEARLVRDELENCQRSEGVNHYENCRWLTEKYLTMLKDNKVCSLAAFRMRALC